VECEGEKRVNAPYCPPRWRGVCYRVRWHPPHRQQRAQSPCCSETDGGGKTLRRQEREGWRRSTPSRCVRAHRCPSRRSLLPSLQRRPHPFLEQGDRDQRDAQHTADTATFTNDRWLGCVPGQSANAFTLCVRVQTLLSAWTKFV
jgi:hypothetical protein